MSGDRLVGVQNLTAPVRVVSFELSDDLMLRNRRVLIAGAPEINGITTATMRKGRILAVSGRATNAGGGGRTLVEIDP